MATANVTIRIDNDLLVEARHVAVDHRLSLSAWVARLIEERVRGEEAVEAARRRALRRLEQGLHLGGQHLTREQAHER
jgi:predicted transcriptional regulator